MKATNSLVLVAVLGMGVTIGLMMRPGPSPSPEATAATPVTKLARPTTTKNPRPVEPEIRTPDAGTAHEAAAQPIPDKAIQGLPIPNERMHEMVQQIGKSRTRKIDERLAVLKKRLKLTPEQEAKVRELMEKANPAPAMTADGRSFSFGGPRMSPGDEQAKISELLNPEQKDEYQEFQKEQRENRMEIAYNREMARLQEQLTLTPEQKDKVYQALGDVLRNEASQPDQPMSLDAAKAAKQARNEALRPILTPEQMESYEAIQGMLPFNMSEGPGGMVIGGTPGTVISGGGGLDPSIQFEFVEP